MKAKNTFIKVYEWPLREIIKILKNWKCDFIIVLPLWMSKTRERLRFCVIEINKGQKHLYVIYEWPLRGIIEM